MWKLLPTVLTLSLTVVNGARGHNSSAQGLKYKRLHFRPAQQNDQTAVGFRRVNKHNSTPNGRPTA